jgi:cytochrome c oxidase assembly protein subunit 15
MQSESVIIYPSTETTKVKIWLRRFVWKIAIATLALMGVGSATRVMNAGLACPDWPLCYGQLVPGQYLFNLQVFLEWFHRLDAALIGLSTVALVGLAWFYHKSLPLWFPILATCALALIVWQGILGGLTVTQLLRFDIVTAHLATALLFLATLVAIGTASTEHQPKGTNRVLFWSGAIAASLVYLQSILGGLVGSRWAVHQCLNGSQLCQVMNNHLFGVLPSSLAILTLTLLSLRNSALSPFLKRLSLAAMGLLISQIILGVATLRLHLQVEVLTVSHHIVAALLLSTLVAFSILAQRNCEEVKL